MSATTANKYPSWEPPELGLPRAAIAAVVLVALIMSFCYYAAVTLAPKPRPAVIQVTQAQLTTLPKPAPPPPPPPPPKVIPPPKPLPAITKPPPIESKIVVPTKPLPVVHHQPPPRPIKHYVVSHPTPPMPTPTPPQPPAAPPAPRTDGEPIYGAQMHDIIQANQSVPPALAQLGISGTAYIRIVVAPNGHVISASVARSSGNPLIDQVALDHAEHADLSAFNADMPDAPVAFMIPVEIDADSGN